MATATASVGSDVSGRCATVASRFWTKEPLGMWKPRSFGSWSSTMTTPIPALKPTSTGSEMKLATKPSRRIDAATRIAPTSRVSVADARRSAAGSPAGAPASSAPVRIASVVVVLTLKTRDVPRSA